MAEQTVPQALRPADLFTKLLNGGRRRFAALRDRLEDFQTTEILPCALAPLPSDLVALDSPDGGTLFAGSVSRTHEIVAPHFHAQTHANGCGVATALTVMAAVGLRKRERDLFSRDALRVRTRREVRRGGMSLTHFDALLGVHGLRTELRRGDAVSTDEFRNAIVTAMLAGKPVVVNYDRSVLGQEAIGHISPLTAYHAAADKALVLDTAAHRYPPHWIALDMLHAAMRKPTRPGGPSRGFLIAERRRSA